MNNRKPVTARRLYALKEAYKATPSTSDYALRRRVMEHHMNAMRDLLERREAELIAMMFRSVRRAFTHTTSLN